MTKIEMEFYETMIHTMNEIAKTLKEIKEELKKREENGKDKG